MTYERFADNEARVSESVIDDPKLRMHSEFKAICLTDETRCVTEMHVRFSEKDKISRQCSDDEGCLCTNLHVKSSGISIIFNSSKFGSGSHNSNVNV